MVHCKGGVSNIIDISSFDISLFFTFRETEGWQVLEFLDFETSTLKLRNFETLKLLSLI